MARGRSKSVVQKIASDALSYDEDTLGQNLEVRASFKPARSLSLVSRADPQTTNLKRYRSNSLNNLDVLWENQIKKYDSNLIIDEKSIFVVEDLNDDRYITFQENCEINKTYINQIIEKNNEILNSIDSLIIKFDKISNQTQDFDNESSKLLQVQNEFDSKVVEFEHYLSNFQSLEQFTSMLSRPGTSLVRKPMFLEMLQKLDGSLNFLKSHKSFKDSDNYESKFRQCMTRSLTLIKDYLNLELRKLEQNVNDKLSKKISLELLLFTEFNEYSNESNFAKLFNEIYKRIENHQEYNGLVNDVLSSYFRLRSNLLSRQPHTEFKNEADFVQYCQDQISSFKNIVDKEFQLYKHFFGCESSSDNDVLMNKFYVFSRDIMEPLYDDLRKHILKETNISKLCLLTSLFHKYYEFEVNVFEINYGEIFQPILDNVQARLIFRIQTYIDQKLIRYKPTIEDLNLGKTKQKELSSNPLDIDFPENLFPDVYLPLGKALTLLSNIYELVTSVVFDDLAHYIVHTCIELLKNEFYQVSISHLGVFDTKLNYLKYLIILKTQLNNFDIQYVRNEYTIDFLGGLGDIWDAFKKGKLNTTNNTIIDLAKRSVPRVIDNMIDANEEINVELNNSVNDFIIECNKVICEPILSKDAIKNPLSQSNKFKTELSNHINAFYKKMKFYIGEAQIIDFLNKNLSNQILITYENFYENMQVESPNAHEVDVDGSDIIDVDGILVLLNDIMLNLDDLSETSNENLIDNVSISDT